MRRPIAACVALAMTVQPAVAQAAGPSLESAASHASATGRTIALSLIGLAGASLLLALEDDEHVDPAGILLVPHGRRAYEAGT